MLFPFYVMLFSLKEYYVVGDGKDEDIVRYDEYQVWEANIEGRRLSTDFFVKFLDKEDVWYADEKNINFLLNGSETEPWGRYLDSLNISYTILLTDLQKAIEKESLMLEHASRRGSKITWTSYAKRSDIYSYLKSVTDGNPSYCTIQSIGKTIHKTDIKMLKISNGDRTNEAILVEAGMHGREWVAIASLLYFIDNIAWNFTSQPKYIQNKDWYIIPIVNPDGYEYSMTKDRAWRKNRRRFSGPCDGVDLNRNFDSDWCKRGASQAICAIDYCGPSPFSEQESIALKNLVQGRHFTGYVAVHSFGSAVFFPWAFTGTPTIDVKAHRTVAREMVMAMRKVAGNHFVAGNVNQLRLRKGSGMAIDWMYKQAIKHCYMVESRGDHFLAEVTEIVPSAKEITAGLRKMAELI